MAGKEDQALSAYERVLDQRQQDDARGYHHPDTLRAHMTLGNYQHALGRTGAAGVSYREALEGRAATLGFRHPDTLATRFALVRPLS